MSPAPDREFLSPRKQRSLERRFKRLEQKRAKSSPPLKGPLGAPPGPRDWSPAEPGGYRPSRSSRPSWVTAVAVLVLAALVLASLSALL